MSKQSSDDANARTSSQSSKAPPKKSSLTSLFLSLEQRLMFDAAAAATAAEVAGEAVAQEQADAAVSADGPAEGSAHDSHGGHEVVDALATFLPEKSPAEIVFVDPTVPDYATLLAGITPNTEVIMLDGGQDGITQMADALSGRTGIDAVHIISHGEAGTLQLGTGTLNAETMSGHYAEELSTIRQALSEQADILVYGCDFAAGETGQDAVDCLAQLTGADVQASSDVTGHASLGGDWDLEVRTGAIEARIAIDVQEQTDWVGLLAAPVLDATRSPTLNAVTEDAGAPSGSVGTLVSSLVDFATPSGQVDNVTDADGGAQLGIAISGANTSNGTWWYSINNGSTWNALGAVSDGSARLLAADASTRIYFQADANYNGTMSDAITFHAWDQTSGTNGGTADLNTTSTVRDQFNTVSYSNNNGTVNWGGSWQEIGESNGTGSGMVVVNSYAGLSGNSLQIETDSLSRGASRHVDLSTATSATLSFDYIRQHGGGTNGAVSVDVYNGTSWTRLNTFTINATDASAQSYGVDISAYANANTQIRFIVSGSDSMGRLHLDNIQVTAIGTGGGTSAYSHTSDTAGLTVTAVNDAPTDVSLSANTVAENAANGTVVGTVSGSDSDSGDTKTYSLTDSAGGRFAINSGTGVLTVADGSQLNYEAATSHSVTVRVTDAGGLTYDETFTINLTDVNEATPTLTSNGGGATASIRVNENSAIVTTVTATDGDSRQTLAYSISGGPDSSKFTIDSSTGTLRFVTAPNYEAPTDSGANNVYDVTVQVSDDNGGVDTQAIAVTVSNVNEGPTDLSLSANTVAENAANGTVVGTVTGTDVDAGETKSYTLLDSAGGRFAINRTTGVITVANGTLLNYEAATSHSVTVRVTDRGGLTYNETFTINLTNVNDAPSGTTATVTLTEDTSHTFTSTNFGFSDADVGDSFSAVRIDTVPTAGRLTLSGVAVTAGQVVSVADLTAGNLVFTPAANANGTGYARLTFSVRDSANAYDPTPNTLTMNVTAVNDAPTDLALSANTVAENAANGTVVGTVTGTDVDAGETKSYTLLDSAGGRFAINRTTGVITVANGTLLNYEAATSHSVTVRVTDRGGLTYNETFTINLTNVNDAPSGTTATVTLTEDTSHTFTSANFGFSDADVGDSFSAVRIDTVPTAGRLTLSGVAVTAGQVVSVADLTAGNLVFTPAANANGTGYARLTFSVRDSANAYDPTPNTLTMNVTAVNDAPTDLALSANTVAENAANGTVVGTVTGTDVDAGETKSYTLLDSAGGRFAINRTTGVITVANGTLLNYEAATSHSVTVRVTDRGGLTYNETFTINLTNVNDAPSGTTATVTLTEDTSHTFTSTNFGFSDADVGDSFSAVRIDTVPTAGRLTLSGVAVTAGQVVSVADLTAGNLVFTPAANANGTGYARLTFSMRDSANAYDPTPNTLTMNVTAVNDAPVLVVNSGSTVAEGGRDTIGSAELAVADVDHVATQLTYSIGTGPAHGRLELTTRPGVSASSFTQADITANRLVYVHNGSETTSDSFTFTVRDRAGGALAATTVTLTITPVNDAPTIVSNGGGGTAAINVAEHVSAVTMVVGRDADLPAQTLSYSVSGGLDQALFTIDAATGALSFTVPPDFSVPIDSNGDNVYVVQVRVTDTQGASVTQTLHITVTEVAESSVPAGLPPSLVPTTPQAVPTQSPVVTPLNPVVSGPVIEAAAPGQRFADGVSGIRAAYQTTREAPFRPEELRRGEGSPRVEDGEGRANDQAVPVPPIPVAGEDMPVNGQEDGRSPEVLSELLFAKLDAVIEELEQAIATDGAQQIYMTRIAAAAGVVLSAGFVAWALRSTALAASLFATVPAWQTLRPLPVLAADRRERQEQKREQEDVARAEPVE